ncbi:WD40-repeat-containing domain protein [Zopfochytrium polystomum]|nr:WD40-repeat-containing domain protein [Zopfochytrium polystomum]
MITAKSADSRSQATKPPPPPLQRESSSSSSTSTLSEAAPTRLIAALPPHGQRSPPRPSSRVHHQPRSSHGSSSSLEDPDRRHDDDDDDGYSPHSRQRDQPDGDATPPVGSLASIDSDARVHHRGASSSTSLASSSRLTSTASLATADRDRHAPRPPPLSGSLGNLAAPRHRAVGPAAGGGGKRAGGARHAPPSTAGSWADGIHYRDGTATPATHSVAGFSTGAPGSASTFATTRRTGRSIGNLREPTFQGVFRPKFSRKCDSEVYCTKFSGDDDFVAIALGNSNVQVYSTRSNDYVRTLVATPDGEKLPCTTLAFRPDNSSSKNRNVLAAGYADGRLIHWHPTSGQKISTISEGDAQINCVTYQGGPGFNAEEGAAGRRFASCGSEGIVRVYDGANHRRIARMSGGTPGLTAGHSNRAFSVRFHPRDPNVLVSGGWDNTLQIWDVRVGHSVRSIHGPHVCGDAVDIDDAGDRILSASFAKSDQLQLWSFKDGRLLDTIPWSIMDGDRRASMLYSASFGHPRSSAAAATASTVTSTSAATQQQQQQLPPAPPSTASTSLTATATAAATSAPGGRQYVVAGGCGVYNEVKLFSLASKRAVGMAQGFSQSVYSVALSASEKMVAVVGSFRALYVYDIDPHHQPGEFIY